MTGQPTHEDKLLAYGKIAWLWAASDLHRDWPVGLQAKTILPAIETRQYSILEHDGYPVAYCCWAFLNAQREKEYLMDPVGLSPADWQCGDRLWFVDWISPFSPRYTWELRTNMARKFPDVVGRSIRVKKGNSQAKVAVYAGREIMGERSFDTRRHYFGEMAAFFGVTKQ